MIKEAIGTGSTIQAAIEEAQRLLSAPEGTDIQHEVLEMPQKKTFGIFGGSPARVRAYYEVPDEEPKTQVKAEVKAKAAEEPETEAKGFKALFKDKSAKKVEKEAEVKPETKTVSTDEDKVLKYLTDIVEGMGLSDVKITISDNGVEYVYNIECDDYGALIGRRGETIDAIQYLIRLYANKNGDEHKRVSVNVGDYRKRRADSLSALAGRTAKQVLRSGRSVTLEPMNPYERRIVHTAIQAIDGVDSHSIGQDESRRVVISLAEGARPAGGGRPNQRYNKGGKKGGKRPPSNDRSQSRSTAPAPAANNTEEQKAQKKVDVTNAARYGKIEIKKEADI